MKQILIILLCFFTVSGFSNDLDTIPAIDSIVYKRITGDFYKRVYYPEYTIIYGVPEDSISFDADSVYYIKITDSLQSSVNTLKRRRDRLENRRIQTIEQLRGTRVELQDAKLLLRETLKYRRRYYRRQ